MGWLTDVGNVAVGAIDRDRQITKEDLAIRAENLQANRNMLIKQKEKKYDKELDNYYAEKKKFDDINEMNRRYEAEEIDKGTYAAFALSNTIPGWDKLSNERKYELETSFKGKTIDYKLTGSPEEINKRAAAAQTMINDETSKRIKDAKGNSFLINTILGDKKKAEASLLEAMESKLNAAETVSMTEQNTEHSGLDVNVGGDTEGINWTSFKKKNDTWLKDYGIKLKAAEYNGTEANKTIAGVINTGGILGFDTKPFVKIEDGKITSWTQQGDGFVNTYEQTYKSLYDKQGKKDAIIKSYNYNNVIGGADLDTGKLNDTTIGIVAQRASIADIKGNDVFNMLPIGVINENNIMSIDGKDIQLTPEQFSKAISKYKTFLLDEAIQLVDDKDTGFFDPQTDENFIKAYNELQSNMSRNREDGVQTNLAYEFKKDLFKTLDLSLPKETSSIKDEGLDIKDLDNEISEIKKSKIKKSTESVVDNSVINYTDKGKDYSIDFKDLDKNDVEQLKIASPEIYKKYLEWNKKSTYKKTKADTTFDTNTNKFKNMLEVSENKILANNNTKLAKGK